MPPKIPRESLAGQEAIDGSSSIVKEPYIDIQFQLGPVGVVGVNGTTIEQVLRIAQTRLEGFQRGAFKSKYNDHAIFNIQQAIFWLEERTRQRDSQGVEGTNQANEE